MHITGISILFCVRFFILRYSSNHIFKTDFPSFLYNQTEDRSELLKNNHPF